MGIDDFYIKKTEIKEEAIVHIMAPIHTKILLGKYVSWGTLMRAGIKCASLTSIKKRDISCTAKKIKVEFKTDKTSIRNNQQKKDKDDGSNVSLSGDTKQLQGQTNKDERMPESVDNHVENPQDESGAVTSAAKDDTGNSTFPADSKSKKGWGKPYGY